MTRLVAVLSALALVGLDYLLIVVCFLYRPAGAEYLAAAMLVGGGIAVALRWRWLLLASQNAVTGLGLVRVMEAWDTLGAEDIVSLVVFAALLALGNLLAWLVARALRPPPGRALRRGVR